MDTVEDVGTGASKNASDSVEQRKQKRFSCSGFAEVVLHEAAFLFRGTIRDLSLTGCYVQSRARLMLERGTAVELRFCVSGDELLLPARVMIIRPGAGAGFEFFGIQPEAERRLASLIKKLADPGANSNGVAGIREAPNPAAASTSKDLWRQDR